MTFFIMDYYYNSQLPSRVFNKDRNTQSISYILLRIISVHSIKITELY